MYESLKPLYPAGPCNRTDPIVRHDSPYKGGAIVKIYEPQNDEETTKFANDLEILIVKICKI